VCSTRHFSGIFLRGGSKKRKKEKILESLLLMMMFLVFGVITVVGDTV
jgi:hypothetical protein